MAKKTVNVMYDFGINKDGDGSFSNYTRVNMETEDKVLLEKLINYLQDYRPDGYDDFENWPVKDTH